MKQFEYTIKDPLGIHARPAGMLAKVAKGFGDTVVTLEAVDGAPIHTGKDAAANKPVDGNTVETPETDAQGGEKTVKAIQLMKLMGLGIKTGETVTIGAEGPDEDAAIEAIRAFFEENL